MAGLAGVVAEDGGCGDGVGVGVAAAHLVEAEVVLGAVGGGDGPVLAVVVAVGAAGVALDAGAVVALGAVGLDVAFGIASGGGVADELGGAAAQGHDRVVGHPAQVAGLVGLGGVVGGFGELLSVVLAAAVAAFDEAGAVVPAFADPGCLGEETAVLPSTAWEL